MTDDSKALDVEGVYSMPIAAYDGSKKSRLNVQHRVLKMALGSLYWPRDRVERALAPVEGRKRKILDVGTGSGIWAEEMALAFPHAEVLGVDLALPARTPSTPSNCAYEYLDANSDEAWKQYRSQFDVVHMRMIGMGVFNYRKLYHRVAEILRPGGILLNPTGVLRLYDENKNPIPDLEEGEPGWVAFQSVLTGMSLVVKKENRGVVDIKNYSIWLEESALYENVGWHDLHVPVGPWTKDSSLNNVGELFRTMVYDQISFVGNAAKRAYDEETVDRWIKLSRTEVQEMKPKVFEHYIYVWATRTAREWIEYVEQPSNA